MDTILIDKLQYLQIGVQGENAANDIPIDMTPWVELFPNAMFHLLFKPYNSTTALPMVTTYDAETHILTWTATLSATITAGVGYTEVRALDGDLGILKKSRIIPTSVENSVTGVEGGTIPAPYEDWANQVLAYKDATLIAKTAAETAQGKAEDAQSAAETAQGKAEDAQTAAETAQGKAEDAQTAAETAQGKAEDAQTAAETAKGLAESAKTDAVSAKNDAVSAKNDSVAAKDASVAASTLFDNATAEATTLQPGSSATATITTVGGAKKFLFGIPKGDTGQAGTVYGNTVDMSPTDSTKVSTAIGAKLDSDQGSANENKFMKVGSTGELEPSDLPDGSTSAKGVVQLEDSTSSSSTTKAATPNSVKSAYELADGKAAPSTVLSLTLASGSWTSATPPTQTVSATGVTASNNIIVGIAATATSAQFDAASAAKLMCTAQGSGEITVTCYGDEPTENIPIAVMIVG